MSTRPRYSVTAGSPPVPPRQTEEYAEPTEGMTTVPRDVKKAIEYIRAELAQPITVADLTRVEVHGPAQELEKLKRPLADLNPEWFALETTLQK